MCLSVISEPEQWRDLGSVEMSSHEENIWDERWSVVYLCPRCPLAITRWCSCGRSFSIAISYFCHFRLYKPAYNGGVFEPPCNRFCPNCFASYLTLKNYSGLTKAAGTRWRSWLQPYATNRKVAGSVPDSINGIFVDIILPAALWSWDREPSGLVRSCTRIVLPFHKTL
jgi:hypothetical protein